MIGKLLLAAAATLAVSPALAADVLVYPAAPPPSTSPVYAPTSMITADVTGALGWAGTNGNLDSDSFSGLAAARINIPLGAGGWNQEFEVGGLWMFNGDASVAGIFSHTYYKNPAAALGFVAGYAALDPFSSGSFGLGTVGAEGAIFMPNATVLGKVTYNFPESGSEFWNLAVEGRYYFTPNTKLTGAASWFDINDTWVLSTALEHRWTGTGFSNFIQASYMPNSVSDNWALLVGVRGLFDNPGSTLQSHDWEIPFSALSGMPL